MAGTVVVQGMPELDVAPAAKCHYTERIPRKVKALSLADECSRGTRPSKMYSDQGNINVIRNGSEYMKKRDKYTNTARPARHHVQHHADGEEADQPNHGAIGSFLNTALMPAQMTTRTMRPMSASANSRVIESNFLWTLTQERSDRRGCTSARKIDGRFVAEKLIGQLVISAVIGMGPASG